MPIPYTPPNRGASTDFPDPESPSASVPAVTPGAGTCTFPTVLGAFNASVFFASCVVESNVYRPMTRDERPSHRHRPSRARPSRLARASFASTSRRTLKPTRAVPRRIFERFPSRRLARVVERARGGSNGSRKGLRTRFARDRSPRGRERRRLREDRRERNEPVDRRARADADFSK